MRFFAGRFNDLCALANAQHFSIGRVHSSVERFFAALRMTSRGSLALVLHAHLPFVRHPEHEHFLEEDWLFEAITETYIPLLRMMQRLVKEGVPFKLTMSLTPTLCAMLQD